MRFAIFAVALRCGSVVALALCAGYLLGWAALLLLAPFALPAQAEEFRLAPPGGSTSYICRSLQDDKPDEPCVVSASAPPVVKSECFDGAGGTGAHWPARVEGGPVTCRIADRPSKAPGWFSRLWAWVTGATCPGPVSGPQATPWLEETRAAYAAVCGEGMRP